MTEKFQLEQIRKQERQSHTALYSNAELYHEDSWLHKPVKTVLEQIPFFQDHKQMQILDLGCGVGRNSIALARAFSHIPCQIDCVDILDLAIDKLMENALQHNVDHIIRGISSSIEDFSIPEDNYDWILAVSSLEHVASEDILLSKLGEIRNGIRKNGEVILIMNSNVREFDLETKQPLPAQFEVNLPTQTLLQLLTAAFCGWEICIQTVKEQIYQIPREGRISELHTSVVTFAARQ